MDATKYLPVYRLRLVRETDREVCDTVRTPDNVAGILREFFDDCDRECFAVILLDSRHRVSGICTISTGTINSSTVRVADVFKPAIVANAKAIILGHNHPSGDVSPSGDDIRITQVLFNAGKLLEVDVLDHVIVGSSWDKGHSSLKELNYMLYG